MKMKQKKLTNNVNVSAVELLQAEATRLKVMAKAMKNKPKLVVEQMAWAFNLSAAFLNSLNAPERINKFKEVIKKS